MEVPRRRRLIPVLITAAVIALIATTAILMSRESAVDTGPATDPATDSDSAETTIASFTRKDPEAVLLSLTWESETCTYEGPTEITAGPVELVYVNGSDIDGRVDFMRLDEGYTVEDAYNRHSWPDAQTSAAFWMNSMGPWYDPVGAGRTSSWVFDLEPADYFMACGRTQPVQAVWWGGGFTVEG
jgi:Na+-transporting NADH:ubiquinone oxidoreductase subunit NqrF